MGVRKSSSFINPKIIEVSQETTVANEGCLSIPNYTPMLKGPKKVVIEALNEEGILFTQTFTDFEAHIVLHENDHINGVLFIDRISGKERKLLEPKLRRIKNLAK